MDSLTFPGKIDSLEEIGKFVMTIAEEAGLEKRKAYKLRLAIDEIATNAIVHGYQEAGLEGDLRFVVKNTNTALTVLMYDNGQPYDPEEISDPGDLKRPLEERPIGGLGVFLSIQSVDKFSYERTGNENCHTFVVNK